MRALGREPGRPDLCDERRHRCFNSESEYGDSIGRGTGEVGLTPRERERPTRRRDAPAHLAKRSPLAGAVYKRRKRRAVGRKAAVRAQRSLVDGILPESRGGQPRSAMNSRW